MLQVGGADSRLTKWKKTPGSFLNGSKIRKMKKLGFLKWVRAAVKWVWAAVKPKGFWVKYKLKLKKACDVGPAEGSELESGSDHVAGSGHCLGLGLVLGSDISDSDQDFGSDFFNSNLVSGFDPDSGPLFVPESSSPPFGYVSGCISPPLLD